MPWSVTSAAAAAGGELRSSWGCVCNRVLEDPEALVEIDVRDDDRDEDAHDVPVRAARKEDEPALAGRGRRRTRELRSRLHELEGKHRPEPAHLSDLRRAPRDLLQAG